MMVTLAFSMRHQKRGIQWSTLAENGIRMEHTTEQRRSERNSFFSFEVGHFTSLFLFMFSISRY